jgi:hypothetical protein
MAIVEVAFWIDKTVQAVTLDNQQALYWMIAQTDHTGWRAREMRMD